MKLSKRSEYALRALTHIASAGNGDHVRIDDIAGRENIPYKFLEGLLRHLANAGVLRSKRGVGGGYALNRPAGTITLGEVIRLMDGPLAPLRCVSVTAYAPCSCPDEATCGLRAVMLDVRDAIAAILDRTTVGDITRNRRRLKPGAPDRDVPGGPRKR